MNMPESNLLTNRREFLETTVTGIVSYLFPFIYPTASTNVVIVPKSQLVYTVPDSVRSMGPKDIDEIVGYLNSEQDIETAARANPKLVPSLIDLVQFNYHSLTGKTYRGHMSERFKEHKYIRNSPIDVMIERGLVGMFVHSDGPEERNYAQIGASLRPVEFLNILAHELIHAIYGMGEIRAYAHAHRDITHMTALFPQLLLENDANSPLMDNVNYYVGVMEPRKIIGPTRIVGSDKLSPIIWYLHLLANVNLHKLGEVRGDTYLDKVVEFRINPQKSFAKDVERDIQSLWEEYDKQYGKDAEIKLAILLAKSFADATEQYILTTNPNFPEDKKQLLKTKMEKIRKRFD